MGEKRHSRTQLERVSKGFGYPNPRDFPSFPRNPPITSDFAGPLAASCFLFPSHFLLLRIARIERILTKIGHVLGKTFVPAQTRTLRKREEAFSAADL